MTPKFGPAGNSESFAAMGYKSTLFAPEYCAKFGLTAYEYQCGLGVRVKAADAAKLGAAAGERGVSLSLHAPYYISLSSLEEEKRRGSARYFLESAQAVSAMGGARFVVHSGSCGKQSREQALALAVETLRYCIAELDAAGFREVTVCPETMGKLGQLGTLEEVLALCAVDERILPCIDFGHLNARTLGGLKTKADYAAVLDAMENAVGIERASQFHSHFSKIEYTAGGEKRHLTFADTAFGPEPQPLMELIAERGWGPTFICESDGTQAEDAAALKQLYTEALQRQ